MTEVVSSLLVALDACDLVDASHSIVEDKNKNADFEDFTQSTTLLGETVEEAQAAAAEAIAISPATTEVVSPNNNNTASSRCSIGADRRAFSSAARDCSTKVLGGSAHQTATTTAGDSKSAEPGANNNNSSNRFVTPKDFELLKVIGMGAFGKVLQVRNKQSKQIQAMKIISKRQLRKKSGYIENVQAERNILQRVNHPFVVKMHCSFQTREKLFILMDFLAGGELFLRLGREGIFLEKDAAFYLAETISALDHLHTLGILHRDLKPENILLCNDGHICLTDFGLAKDFGTDWSDRDGSDDQERARTICGTQEYMAPEMVARKGYGKAADYWSLGCIAYEMLNGLPPFSSKGGSKELYRKILSEKVKMPPGTTAAACKLLKGLLNRNPDKRLGSARSTMFEVGGVAGLKQQPFFAKIDWIKLDRKQLEPPYDLNVDHEHDLRHFHNEFTDMPLPRSVKLMTTEDHTPRRVASETFRGFSFIQDDFCLPSRDAKEIENYWKAIEEDGESDSDLASSKCDNEDEAAPLPQPEKKKRPPRKRKKKNKNNADLAASETASVASVDTAFATPTPSDTEGDAVSVPPSSKKGTEPQNYSSDHPLAQSAATASFPHSNNSTTASASSSFSSKLPDAKAQAPKTPPNPKPVVATATKTWSSVGVASGTTKNRNRLAGYSPTTSKTIHNNNNNTVPNHRPTVRTKTLIPPAAIQTAPAPGSWASRLHNNNSSSNAAAGITTRNVAMPEASPARNTHCYHENNNSINNAQLLPPSPSSDWRTHASPQIQRAIQRGALQSEDTPPNHQLHGASPSVSSSPSLDRHQGGTPNAWPSLKGFPAAPSLMMQGGKSNEPGSKPKITPTPISAPPTTKKPLRGAWGSRT